MASTLEQLINVYDPDAPLARAATPPSSWYTNERIFKLEKQTVFSHSWQVVGRIDQLRSPGDYISAEVAGEPLLVVKGSDRLLRGFFNVCRHHAAMLVTDAAGTRENLRCPYHGWTYDLKGELIGTPDFAAVEEFDKSANGLMPIPVSLWGNWIFVNFTANGSTLRDYLGAGLIEKIESLGLQRLRWLERRCYTVKCNWKVFVDNYLDGGYHVPHVHEALNTVLDHKTYTIETDQRVCIQSAPMVSNNADPVTADVRRGRRALYFWIYPNLMINWYEGVMDTNLVCPRSVDQTDVIFDFYFSDISDAAREQNRQSISVSEKIQAEDKAICESVQRGLNSRAYDLGRLSVRREAGEHLFHRLLHADLKRGIAGSDKT
ncbi:MAG TPA: aromatic ring-hydroxylating dioxygenase subunit alpha [Candidatus Binatia bacterium]|jgi:choline monooxygenase